MPLTVRVQVLMDPKEGREYRRIAKARKTSVGRLIRDAAREKLLQDVDQERRRKAAEAICNMNLGPMPDWEEMKKILDERYDHLYPDLDLDLS